MDEIRNYTARIGARITRRLVRGNAGSWIVAGTVGMAALSAAAVNGVFDTHAAPSQPAGISITSVQPMVMTFQHHCHHDSGL